jgi:hypothetical protein
VPADIALDVLPTGVCFPTIVEPNADEIPRSLDHWPDHQP